MNNKWQNTIFLLISLISFFGIWSLVLWMLFSPDFIRFYN